jgi:hypothetical protein
MNPFAASLIRTIVPIVVGSILGLLTRAGLDIDLEGQQALSTLIDSTFIGAYYLVIRIIETKVPQVGWLLGLAKTPDSYTKDPATTGPKHRA